MKIITISISILIIIILFYKKYESFTIKKSLNYIKELKFKNSGYSLPSSDLNKFKKDGYPKLYGNLKFEGLNEIIKNINDYKGNKWIKNKTFIDLGSGDGRVNIWSIYFNIKKSIGIELSKKRHNIAMENKKKLNIEDQEKIEFINEDLFKYNMKDVDIIYISSYAFSETMKIKLFNKFDNELKKHTLIFSTKELINNNLKFIKKFTVNQSWSEKSEMHFYEKI